MSRRNLLRSALIAATGLTFGGNASARGVRIRFRVGGGMASAARKIYSADTLTRNDLESCLTSHREIELLEHGVETTSSSLETEKVELDRLSGRIAAERQSLNRYSQTDVDRFNRSIEQYERRRIAFNTSVQAHNVSVQRANSAVEVFNRGCASKKYYEDDMLAARSATGISISD